MDTPARSFLRPLPPLTSGRPAARAVQDLSALATGANNEYSTSPGHSYPVPSPGGTYPTIIFNVCGTVARTAVPYNAAAAQPNTNTNLPNPHIRGTAVQFIDPPTQTNLCADIDTCDQDTNPSEWL